MDEENHKFPEIIETGSTGTQGSADKDSALIPLEPTKPFDGLLIAKAVAGLAASKPRSLGGEAAANMLSGAFMQLSNNNAELKAENKELHDKYDNVKDEFSESNKEVAVLKERLHSTGRFKHFQNISILIGTTLFALAFKDDLASYRFILGSAGALLVLLGWFISPGKVK